MRRFRSLVQKGNEQSQNEAEIEHENHNTDPATLLWGKRELAINDLYAALSDGSLLALVRDPASGQMFQLTAPTGAALCSGGTSSSAALCARRLVKRSNVTTDGEC